MSEPCLLAACSVVFVSCLDISDMSEQGNWDYVALFYYKQQQLCMVGSVHRCSKQVVEWLYSGLLSCRSALLLPDFVLFALWQRTMRKTQRLFLKGRIDKFIVKIK
jgi:hypothetical protein